MNITVEQALTLGMFSEARVLAGHKGLSRPVHYVDIMEVPDPDRYFRRGILFVSSWYAVRHDVEAQCRLIQTAHEVGAAGFALKVDRYLGQVPDRVLALANELEIPIIDIVEDVPYLEITHPLLTRILHDQSFKLEYYFNIHKMFRRVALEGGSFRAIVKTLNSLINKRVAVCDSQGKMLAWFPLGNDNGTQLRVGMAILAPADIRQLAYVDHHTFQKLPLGSGELLVFPIRIESQTYGYFLVEGESGHCTELDFIALENASTIAALEATKRTAIIEVKHHFRRDFVYDLINGNLASEKSARMRAAALGWDFLPPVVIIMVDIDGFANLVEEKQDEGQAMNIKSRMLALTRNTVSTYSQTFITANISDSCIAVAHLGKGKETYDLLRELKANLNQGLKDVSVSIAASEPCTSLLAVGCRYRETCELMEISRKTRGPGQIAVKEELDVYRLLYRCGPQKEMSVFCRDILGPLLEEGGEDGAELLHTLDGFLRVGAVVRSAAQSLFIHENTLRYRLKKIEDILGMDLKNPSHRFRLAIALHIVPFLD